MSNQKLMLQIGLVVLCGAGCGGSGGSDFRVSDFIGDWFGTVVLSANGCPREIPEEARELSFSHQISEVVTSEEEVTVTLADGDIQCIAERVKRSANTFLAVCPERALPGFLDDYECTEEIVWSYTLERRLDSTTLDPVLRTAYVRCFQRGEPQFACPVEYSGSGVR